MDHDDFDNVSWRNDPETDVSRPNAAGPSDDEEGTSRPGASGKRRSDDVPQQAGHLADAVDLGGIGDGRLDCTVDTPLKENDGTKDAYVSYLVTTHVGLPQKAAEDKAYRRIYVQC